MIKINPPITNQYGSITIAKGIAIILMVIGHSGCPKWMHDFIYMFHMPLFFLVSGYCFKERYLKDAKSFVLKRIKGLYFPFVKWGLIFVLLHDLFYELYLFNDQHSAITPIFYTWKDVGEKMLLVLCGQHYEPLLGGYWFLMALLRGAILSYILLRLCKGKANIASSIAFALTILFAFFSLNGYGIRISRLFIVIFLFTFGYFLKSIWRQINCYWIVAMFVIVCICSRFFYSEITNYTSTNVVGYIIAAVIGCIMMIGISEKIDENFPIIRTFLLFVGRNTLTILTWHFLCFKFVSFLIIVYLGKNYCLLGYHPVIPDNYEGNSAYWLMYSIVGIVFPCMIVYIRETFEEIKK